jgi:predicted dehydrogenase
MRTLSLIQVGGGIWGRGWAELVHRTRGFRLEALVDASAKVRSWASVDLRVPVFSDLEQALERTAAGGVLLVSPPETHRPLAELALAQGLHVVTEKPLALALDDASALVKLSERTGLHVMVTQNYRFRRQSRALQALVSSGALGKLLGVRIVCRRDLRDSWILPWHWRSEMPHPYLLDMAIHHIDMLRMITGREIADVDALAWRVPDSPFRMEPNVQALLGLDDGTPVAYEGDFAAAVSETSWNGDWELVGEEARALWTGGIDAPLRGRVVLERYGAPAEPVPLPRLPALDRVAVLREFRRAIIEGTPPECSAADNINSLAAILRIARSTETRRPVGG